VLERGLIKYLYHMHDALMLTGEAIHIVKSLFRPGACHKKQIVLYVVKYRKALKSKT